ncbi:MAG TPA: NERD domain-containing protein [Streptosporangiaceae bacterium]|nr:NERD domain-containing protein [Streptosporangiaceae bacterium]
MRDVDRETWPYPRAAGSLEPADEPDQQARGSLAPAGRPLLAGLVADPRAPIWIGRAIAAGVAGSVAAIWADWRIGVTVAALVAIADIIYRSKTTAVIPAAARVTSAQRRSRRRLAALRMKGYVTLHARTIPGSEHVIDHLVIGPAGVYALDSERWDRRLPVRTATGDQIYHGPFSQRHRLEHARWEAAQASRLLSEAAKFTVDVRPAMVVYGPTIPWTVLGLLGVDVLSGRRLRKYLRRQARARRAEQLDARQISRIQVAADRALPAAGR